MIWADTDPSTTRRVPVEPARPRPGQVVARTAYTTAHPMPWKGKVSAYLVTKAVVGGRARSSARCRC